jgi:selenocysteine lyase/cysteine desulfurase
LAAVNYLAELGRDYGRSFVATTSSYTGRRQELKQAMQAISAYERPLLAYLLTELQTIPGLTLYGITHPEHLSERCPTVAFTKTGYTPRQIAAYLGERGIFVWDGNYLALSVTERLGLEESGGMVRIGLVHYNTQAEIERLLAALREL